MKRIGDFSSILRHIRELNEKTAVHGARLDGFESPQQERKTDTDRLGKRRLLHAAICDVFNESEFRLFVFGLGGDVEVLDGENLSDVVLSFILWMQRNGRFAELLAALAVERPRVVWDRFW